MVAELEDTADLAAGASFYACPRAIRTARGVAQAPRAPAKSLAPTADTGQGRYTSDDARKYVIATSATRSCG
jgi:hypothetical protein